MRKQRGILTVLVLASLFSLGLSGPPALADDTVVTTVTDKVTDLSNRKNIHDDMSGGGLSLTADEIAALPEKTEVSVKGNKVIADSATFYTNYRIYGGYLLTDGTATTSPAVTFTVSGNSVSATGSIDLWRTFGGYGEVKPSDTAAVLRPINVTDNEVTLKELTGKAESNYIYGGYTNLGNADSNRVTVTGPKDETGSNNLTIRYGVYGGASGGAPSGSSYGETEYYGGSADDNTVELTNVNVAASVNGGYAFRALVGLSSTNRNVVTIEDSTVTGSVNGIYGGLMRLTDLPEGATTTANADGTTTVSYTENNKTITYTLPAAANTGANHNIVTLTNVEHSLDGGNSDLSVYGGDASDSFQSSLNTSTPLTVDDNQVIISSTLTTPTDYQWVYGGNAKDGNADRNSVSITGTGNNISVTDVSGGYAKGSGNRLITAEKNEVYLKSVTLPSIISNTIYVGRAEPARIAGGYVEKGLAGLSGASKNTVTIEDSVIVPVNAYKYYNVSTGERLYGGYMTVADTLPSGITTTTNADGTTTVTYTIDGNTYTLPGALSAGANENTITLTNLANTDKYGANVYGGLAKYDSSNNKVYSPLTANGNQVTISSDLDEVTAYETVYGGSVDEGNAAGNNVSITGSLLKTPDSNGSIFNTTVEVAIGGNHDYGAEKLGNAEGNTVYLENVEAAAVYGGKAQGLSVNGASGNTVTLKNSMISQDGSNERDSGVVFGGYLSIPLYENYYAIPSISSDAAAKTTTVIDSNRTYIVADAENAGAKGNTVDVSYDLDTAAMYRQVVGGYTEAGSANTNQVTVSGKQLEAGGTNLTIWSESEVLLSDTWEVGPDSGLPQVPAINVAAAGGIAAYGTANENTLSLTNTTLNNNVYGGLVGITLSGLSYDTDFQPGELFQADGIAANKNQVFLTNASSTGSVYGGYVVPTEYTGIAEAQANENTVQLVQTLDQGTSYGDVLGGAALYGAANSNKVILQGTEKGTIAAESVIGGYTGGTSADSNSVALANAKVSGSVVGGTTVLPTQKSLYDYVTFDDGEEIYKYFHITEIDTGVLSLTAAADQSAQGNTVSLAKVEANGPVLGGLVMQGTAEGNTVTLVNGSAAADVYGGISGVGAAKGNTVTISGSTAKNVYGGAAGILGTDAGSLRSTLLESLPTVAYTSVEKYSREDGDYVDQGTATLTDVAYVPTVTSSVSSASGNTVNLVSGTVDAIYGGYAVNSVMDTNTAEPKVKIIYNVDDDVMVDAVTGEVVEASDAMMDIMTAGDLSSTETTYKSGDANDNTVNVDASTVNKGITGGYSQSGAANGNTVTFYSGTVAEGIIGGKSDSSTANGNTVNFYSGTNNTNIVGGQAESDANNNTVNFISGTVENGITGGYSQSGTATGNTINFYSGTVDSGITGGYSNSGAANSNILNIYSGTIAGTIAGGQSASGAANDNIVNIYGGTLASGASLYGGVGTTSTGNTLNLYTKGNTVTNLGNFQTLNFYVPADAGAEDTMLTVTGTTSLEGATIQAGIEDSVKLEKGQHIHLIVKEPATQTETSTMSLMSVNTTSDLTTNDLTTSDLTTSDLAKIASLGMMPDKDTVMNSGFVQNKVEIRLLDDHTLVLDIPEDDVPTLSLDTKLFSEDRAAALNLVNNSSDFAATNAYDGALTAWNFDTDTKGDFTPYLVVGGHDLRADTGSYVDTYGLNANLGFVKRTYQKGYTDTFMPFLEYGNGNYTSHLDDGARGDGNQRYIGAGLLARRDLASGTHYEALIHAGRTNGDFHGQIGKHLASYDTSAAYVSAMLGAGKIMKKNNHSMDYYGKVFWTHLGSDSVQMHSDLGTSQYDFDSINSYRTRLGFRWTKDVSPTTSYYAGLAWNYEFGGDAQVRFGTFETPTAGVKGSSGLLELGWQSKIDKDHDWGADLHVTGWAGVQRGFTYSATVSRAF